MNVAVKVAEKPVAVKVAQNDKRLDLVNSGCHIFPKGIPLILFHGSHLSPTDKI